MHSAVRLLNSDCCTHLPYQAFTPVGQYTIRTLSLSEQRCSCWCVCVIVGDAVAVEVAVLRAWRIRTVQ